jgi:hypothetical protein
LRSSRKTSSTPPPPATFTASCIALQGPALSPRSSSSTAASRSRQTCSAKAAEYLNEAWIFGGKSPELLVDLLDAQVDDVAAAVAYVRGMPDVDANRVALAGCSFGGIETLLAAERNDGHMFCMGGPSPRWGDEVLAFLRETMSPE